MSTDLKALYTELVEIAHAIVRSGAISMSGHGNISIRIPGRDEFLFTTAPTLQGFQEPSIARLSLDGTVLEGEVPPIGAAVIPMHTFIYQERPEMGCVLHTHSPYATAFAVAKRPIEGWTEAFGIFGLEDGVPLAAYGARGSDQALQNIKGVLTPKTRAVLLANHGVLCFHTSGDAGGADECHHRGGSPGGNLRGEHRRATGGAARIAPHLAHTRSYLCCPGNRVVLQQWSSLQHKVRRVCLSLLELVANPPYSRLLQHYHQSLSALVRAWFPWIPGWSPTTALPWCISASW